MQGNLTCETAMSLAYAQKAIKGDIAEKEKLTLTVFFTYRFQKEVDCFWVINQNTKLKLLVFFRGNAVVKFVFGDIQTNENGIVFLHTFDL